MIVADNPQWGAPACCLTTQAKDDPREFGLRALGVTTGWPTCRRRCRLSALNAHSPICSEPDGAWRALEPKLVEGESRPLDVLTLRAI
jgi:hypothetical protein